MMIVPPVLAAAVAAELVDENVRWAASPSSWEYARREGATALMGVPFTAFAIFWTWTAVGGLSGGKSAPTFFLLWGAMFIVIGLSLLLSPVWAAWRARRVYYVVTDRRAVIFEYFWRPKIRSFEVASLLTFERVSRGGAGGDIVFRRSIERIARGTEVLETGFLGLSDYREAESALRDLLAKAKQSA